MDGRLLGHTVQRRGPRWNHFALVSTRRPVAFATVKERHFAA
jgi:hypothetical protein